jgi:CDGSH iron-sulfur domain-containing protein 3
MSDVVITPNKPIAIELEPGTYYRCTCGKSTNQPFCSGAHHGTAFTPIAFEVKEKKEVHLCNCGKSANAPLCDGSHAK